MISSWVGAVSPSWRLRDLPELGDGASAVHQRDDQPGGGGEAVDAAEGRVLQQIPDLAAVAVAVELRAWERSWVSGRRPGTRGC